MNIQMARNLINLQGDENENPNVMNIYLRILSIKTQKLKGCGATGTLVVMQINSTALEKRWNYLVNLKSNIIKQHFSFFMIHP